MTANTNGKMKVIAAIVGSLLTVFVAFYVGQLSVGARVSNHKAQVDHDLELVVGKVETLHAALAMTKEDVAGIKVKLDAIQATLNRIEDRLDR